MRTLTLKQKRAYIKALKEQPHKTIYEAYKKPSETKRGIYDYLCYVAEQMDGTTPTVILHNSHHFTTAFYFWRNGEKHIRIDTKEHIYMFSTNPFTFYRDYEGN